LETKKGTGKGLLEALAKRACAVVTDDFPAFFIPRMVQAAAGRLQVRLETVDGNGLLPMRAADRVYPTAYAFRRFLQKSLPAHLLERPRPEPFKGVQLKRLPSLPAEILRRWPLAGEALLKRNHLSDFPIDHQVVLAPTRGGARAGRARLNLFLEEGLSRYAEDRNQPEKDGTSRLSPYLHFGHLSVHEVFDALMKREEWFLDRLSLRTSGSKAGWWGMGAAAEAFLDELVTWRELGFNLCLRRKDYDAYESLPEWAQKTLKSHERDKRAYLYDLDAFASANTHDPLWNAAQGELLQEGRIHNYLRMLWGKKILEWTPTPREALRIMIELNNRYALDGRDPNSYSGIFWVLGRYDRPWAPEREVFGTVRYMSSQNTARKVKVGEYIKRYGHRAG
jgi:deoxyribodipyrimidine photo-lyase